MAYHEISLEKRLKDNIRNYTIESLVDWEKYKEQFELIHQIFKVDILMTDRHGDHKLIFGDFRDIRLDLVNEPGIKIRVEDRTVAHIFIRYDSVEVSQKENVKRMMSFLVSTIEKCAALAYYDKEKSNYIDELEEKLDKEKKQATHAQKLDALTGVLNHTYFRNRLKIVDRSQIAPVGALCVNINDWKFVNDHYGNEESDRLIQIVANILQENAKQEYLIGRVDGDVFHVLIPMPMDGECEQYEAAVKNTCDAYEDSILAPSVAIGCVMKENVEENLSNLLSDAEYEMFEDKMKIKQKDGYRKRLEKGLNL